MGGPVTARVEQTASGAHLALGGCILVGAMTPAIAARLTYQTPLYGVALSGEEMP